MLGTLVNKDYSHHNTCDTRLLVLATDTNKTVSIMLWWLQYLFRSMSNNMKNV
jgi:hypothetical protein